MAAPTPGDPALSPDADKAILAEQLRVLYIEGQRLILTGVAAALILVWVLWDHVPHAVLLGWLAVFGVYSSARAAMARAYRRRAANDTDHRAWMRRVQWALAVGGSIWAAACFLFYVPDRIEYQLFLVTMLLGAVVSGLVTLAVYLPAYLAFVTPFVARHRDPLRAGGRSAPLGHCAGGHRHPLPVHQLRALHPEHLRGVPQAAHDLGRAKPRARPSATARWSAPISPSRAFSRRPATTCASRCTP